MTERDLNPDALQLGQEEAKQTKPDDISWGDWMLVEKESLSFRHETIAHMAASGISNGTIAKDLGLTDSRVSILLSNTRIKKRVKEIQAQYWGGNIEKRFKAAVPKAMDIVEETLTDTDDKFKQNLKIDTAKWLLEKVTGKAKQEIDIKGHTIIELFARLDDPDRIKEVIELKAESAKQETSLDKDKDKKVIPAKKKDELSDWAAQNVPEYVSVAQTKERKDEQED